MVAVQMRDEDVRQSRELEAHASHLELCSLAAINHQQIVAYVEHLARRHVPER